MCVLTGQQEQPLRVAGDSRPRSLPRVCCRPLSPALSSSDEKQLHSKQTLFTMKRKGSRGVFTLANPVISTSYPEPHLFAGLPWCLFSH